MPRLVNAPTPGTAGLLSLFVLLTACGVVSPNVERRRFKMWIDHRPVMMEGHLALRGAPDGEPWGPGVEIEGFNREWGVKSRIAAKTRIKTSKNSGSVEEYDVTHRRTLSRIEVEPGTTFEMGAPTTEEIDAPLEDPPLEVTGPDTGQFIDGKQFECTDPSVCSRLEALAADKEIGFVLTLSYQSDIHGPLLLEDVRSVEPEEGR